MENKKNDITAWVTKGTEHNLGINYLIDFTETPSSQQVQQQVSLIQGRVVFKSEG